MDDEDELADDDDDKVDIERNEQVEFPCTFFLFFKIPVYSFFIHYKKFRLTVE